MDKTIRERIAEIKSERKKLYEVDISKIHGAANAVAEHLCELDYEMKALLDIGRSRNMTVGKY